MWTAAFWKDASERAIKTGAQFLLGYIGTAGITDKINGDWQGALIAVGIGVGLSVLTSLLSSLVGSSSSASALPK